MASLVGPKPPSLVGPRRLRGRCKGYFAIGPMRLAGRCKSFFAGRCNRSKESGALHELPGCSHCD